MIIKAGSVTNLTDARFFAAYNVDYLGFCFDPQSTDYISPTQALAIKGWISGPKIVAEFAHQDSENISAIIDFFQPDIIQVQPEDVRFISDNFDLPVILETDLENATMFVPDLLFYLLPYDNKTSEQIQNNNCMFDISSANTFDPAKTQITAIQLKGSPEQETGVKSYDEIAELLEVMRG